MNKILRLIIVSDTHNREFQDSGGDILIHGGDMTNWGKPKEINRFLAFFSEMAPRHKLFIAGNHDFGFQDAPPRIPTGLTYLLDRSVQIEGLKFYGSPWTPEFFNWAFMLPRRSESLARKWACIPGDTDILITHGPPHGTADLVGDHHAGCELLAQRLKELRPPIHIFGHIHEGRGLQFDGQTLSINASMAGHRKALPIQLELGLSDQNKIREVRSNLPISIQGGSTHRLLLEATD